MSTRVFLIASLAALALTRSASAAPTKVSGSFHCAKPDQIIPVQDMNGHKLAVQQLQCTWTKPMQLVGVQTTDGASSEITDIRGDTGRYLGYNVTTMSNADVMSISYFGKATMKDGAIVTLKGPWTLFGGTGKLKEWQGRGKYRCKADADGMSCDAEGNYSVSKFLSIPPH
jgi:hypothetical protein